MIFDNSACIQGGYTSLYRNWFLSWNWEEDFCYVLVLSPTKRLSREERSLRTKRTGWNHSRIVCVLTKQQTSSSHLKYTHVMYIVTYNNSLSSGLQIFSLAWFQFPSLICNKCIRSLCNADVTGKGTIPLKILVFRVVKTLCVFGNTYFKM